MEIKKFVLGDFAVNSYLLSKKGQGILIDVGFEPEPIIDYIKTKKLDLKAILLTHTHLDHIGGLERVRESFNVPVYVHKKEQEWLINPELNGSKSYPQFGLVSCRPAENIIEVDQKLEIGDFSIDVIHTPGHTPGGISYHIAPYLFTGDTLFYRSIGRTDLFGGDFILLEKSIHKKLFTMSNKTVVLPGHGNKTSIKEEKEQNPFLS